MNLSHVCMLWYFVHAIRSQLMKQFEELYISYNVISWERAIGRQLKFSYEMLLSMQNENQYDIICMNFFKTYKN